MHKKVESWAILIMVGRGQYRYWLAEYKDMKAKRINEMKSNFETDALMIIVMIGQTRNSCTEPYIKHPVVLKHFYEGASISLAQPEDPNPSLL